MLFQLDFVWEEELRFRLRSWRVYAGSELPALRFSLSHFLPQHTSSKPIGPEIATRSSCGNVLCVSAIPLSVTGDAVSRPTMSIMIGLGFVAVTVLVAERPSPSSRCFLCLTRSTACWRGCRHCGGAFGSTAPGNKPRLRSRTLIVCLIPPPSVAGRATWTPPSRPFPFCGKRLLAWLTGWCAVIRPITKLGFCLG
jgi:hypothetical protein